MAAQFARGTFERIVARCLMLATLAVAPHLCPAAETLETVSKTADEWVKIRVETARLENAWKEERTLVESMVTALNEQAESAEERRDLVKAQTARDREELDGLRAKIEAETADLQAFETRLNGLTAKLIALRPAMPPRLSDALEMSFRSLEDTKLPPGERMQLAMNVLNRCMQFDRTITVGQDVVEPDAATSAKSLEVIYWGLSHGYAVDRAAQKAWLGAPVNGAWRWELQPDAFQSVLQLIAIATDKADPEFVAVPAAVARSIPEGARN